VCGNLISANGGVPAVVLEALCWHLLMMRSACLSAELANDAPHANPQKPHSYSGFAAPLLFTPHICVGLTNGAALCSHRLLPPLFTHVRGSHMHSADDGCELCSSSSYSDTEGVEFCSACSANMGTSGEGSLSSSSCVCNSGYYMGTGSSCVACEMNTYNPSAGATQSSQCVACAEGENSGPGSASCETPMPTARVGDALSGVEEGGTVVWQSGTGVLEQSLEFVKAFTLMCTSVVERCVVDAMASASSKRRVLVVKHGGEMFSNLVGLVLRGGLTEYFGGGM